MYEGLPKRPGDGSAWTICEDWEAEGGLANDIFIVSDTIATLHNCFTDEPIFLEVIDALLDIDLLADNRYFVKDERLWQLCQNGGTRARAHIECVPCSKAHTLATKEHSNGGHWGRDAVKLALTDCIYSPKLDETIINAIHKCLQLVEGTNKL
ncbi:hypothetical protein HETIRDRAFT_122912 [Heterobasidion irregulare TC 32-1]|uniref:Uncharacterized protein n=1 Tax=Heterobasidion irregulare (strain TC 32-1) TaxID=747525 RepID=W4K8A3_HETIT|nr:uncharacterized protein HETIRDRAFT_122912 [Heterobasidion irregulare TC 32-1]ETW82062.1 hypothetical protein HETIRDRAFT_122912 [Heterobasidion irregulare TC 32-1]